MNTGGIVNKFKSRRLLIPKPFKLVFGDCGIFFYQQGRFEYAYYVFLKKFLKKISKKGTYTFSKRKYWIFIQPNQVVSKKSKNSRMGKGKGNPVRRYFRARIYSPMIEFIGIPYRLIYVFKTFLEVKSRIRLVVCKQVVLTRPNLGKNYVSTHIFKKYQAL